MTPLTILVLAQGKGLRWQNVDQAGVPAPPVGLKQLIPVLGETLVGRTYRQFKTACKVDPIIIGPPDLLLTLGPDFRGLTLHNPGEHVLDGMLALAHRGLWEPGRDTLFVLGDVLFSDLAVRMIEREIRRMSGPDFHVTDDRFLFGRRHPNLVSEKEASECFALFIGVGSYWPTLDLVRRMRDRGSTVFCPKPWAFPRLVRELPPDIRMDRGMWQLPDGWMLESNDYTDDCDSMVEYIAFWPPMLEAARKEAASPT